jgi:hypothetical protein
MSTGMEQETACMVRRQVHNLHIHGTAVLHVTWSLDGSVVHDGNVTVTIHKHLSRIQPTTLSYYVTNQRADTVLVTHCMQRPSGKI